MVELFDSTKQNISLHINNIFIERELEYGSTVKEYLTVQSEGNRIVKRKTNIFGLSGQVKKTIIL
ncbi:MAG: hypothetical protein A2281_16550 [Bacteroidetes bacterium RIFOXYA12_FULL_38_20]|nr:MAG: hypothetical protein A2281_16550 [Bacteroidetes bacterium RIFOXYA12_FULL_38_20]